MWLSSQVKGESKILAPAENGPRLFYCRTDADQLALKRHNFLVHSTGQTQHSSV